MQCVQELMLFIAAFSFEISFHYILVDQDFPHKKL